MISDFCDGDLNVKGASYFEDTINKIDDSTGTWTSTYMCTSTYCACPANLDFSMWDEATLNNWNRTNPSNLTAVPIATLKGYTPLYKNLTGDSYASFYDCYNHILSMKSSYNVSAYSGAAQVEELSDDFQDLYWH